MPPERVGAPTKGAKGIIALLVALVVLVVAGVALAYAANSSPADPHAADNGGDHKEDHQGMDDTLLLDGADGLVGRWLDPEDPGEPPED